jgi:hypothetical protein
VCTECASTVCVTNVCWAQGFHPFYVLTVLAHCIQTFCKARVSCSLGHAVHVKLSQTPLHKSTEVLLINEETKFFIT